MYYQISPTGYPVISQMPLEGFIQYNEANKPQVLITAETTQRLLEEKKQKRQEAKQFLQSTDYKMTVDYYATISVEDQINLTYLRKEARLVLA